MITCSKCGKTLIDSAMFCHMSGVKLQYSITCKQFDQAFYNIIQKKEISN